MTRLLALLLTAMLALALSACGEDDEGDPAPSETPAAQSTPADTAPAETAPAETDPADAPAASGSCTPKQEPGGKKPLPCPTSSLTKGMENVVVMKTSQGTFEMTLDVKRAPETSNSFAYLVKKGFFDGLDFHRVVPDFVIQGGDPNGDGSGGPGYSVVEAPPADLTYTRGLVAMAKAGTDPPGASGSQFYVVTGEDVGLPPEYALLGKVTKGMSAVDKISALGEGDGPPSKPVSIESATIVAR